MARHLRKHWKKYTFGSLVFTLGGSYLTRKFRDNNVIREYCEEAKQYGENTMTVFEKPKKVTVFINPMANKMDAKIQFMKYAAPLFHLSGYDVTIVESEYQGQIRTLMGYIDPDCDAIVVAGGDGTIMEVVNGLMRRWDLEKTRSIPIGIIPLGRENRFYSKYFSSRLSLSPTRRISEAAMDVIRGSAVPVHMLQLQPENGNTLYALSSIHWGVFRDSTEIKDRFKLFGKFRLLMSHVRTALKGWPTDYSLRMWLPTSSKFSSTDSSDTPPPSLSSRDNHETRLSDTTTIPPVSRAVSLHLPIASCRGDSDPGQKKNADLMEATQLADRVKDLLGWEEKRLDVVGFDLCLNQSENLEERLQMMIWPSDLSKWEFVKQGWSVSLRRPLQSLPGTLQVSSSELILQPLSAGQSWLSIDGEPYETIPLAVRVLPCVIRVFTRQS